MAGFPRLYLLGFELGKRQLIQALMPLPEGQRAAAALLLNKRALGRLFDWKQTAGAGLHLTGSPRFRECLALLERRPFDLMAFGLWCKACERAAPLGGADQSDQNEGRLT